MYDLAILGGGPGGYVAAGRAGAAGPSFTAPKYTIIPVTQTATA